MGHDDEHRGLNEVEVGQTSPPRQVTITGDDIDCFAALTGDREKLHMDDEYARTTPYGRRIAHGVHVLGLMSSTILNGDRVTQQNVSYGYDRIRFVRPALIGETVTLQSTIVEKRYDKNEVIVEERCVNQAGELVAIAAHVYKFL